MLDVTFAALSGLNTGAVNFYGITRSPPEEASLYVDRLEVNSIPKSSLFPVFEYATEGPLSQYLM